jgi:large subunit ribosomal protein L28
VAVYIEDTHKVECDEFSSAAVPAAVRWASRPPRGQQTESRPLHLSSNPKSGKINIHPKALKGPLAVMAQQCEICGKKPQFGNRISHAHNVTKRRWNVNLRPVHARVGAATKRIRVCTSCLRSGKVVKA